MASSGNKNATSVGDTSSVLSCPICYEDGPQLDLRVLLCGHLLCVPCATRMSHYNFVVGGSSRQSITCPMCRASQVSRIGATMMLAQLPVALREFLKVQAQKQTCTGCERMMGRDDFMHCKTCIAMICGKCAYRSHKACNGVVEYNDYVQDQCNSLKPMLEGLSTESTQIHDQMKLAAKYYTEMATMATNYAKMLAPLDDTVACGSSGYVALTAEIADITTNVNKPAEAGWPPQTLIATETRINSITAKLNSIKPAANDFLSVQQSTKEKDEQLSCSVRQHFDIVSGDQRTAPVASQAVENEIRPALLVTSSSNDNTSDDYEPSSSRPRLRIPARLQYSPTRPSMSVRDPTEDFVHAAGHAHRSFSDRNSFDPVVHTPYPRSPDIFTGFSRSPSHAERNYDASVRFDFEVDNDLSSENEGFDFTDTERVASLRMQQPPVDVVQDADLRNEFSTSALTNSVAGWPIGTTATIGRPSSVPEPAVAARPPMTFTEYAAYNYVETDNSNSSLSPQYSNRSPVIGWGSPTQNVNLHDRIQNILTRAMEVGARATTAQDPEPEVGANEEVASSSSARAIRNDLAVSVSSQENRSEATFRSVDPGTSGGRRRIVESRDAEPRRRAGNSSSGHGAKRQRK